MKKLIIYIIILFITCNLFAATNQINSNSIKAYRTALEYFDKLEYGKSLKYAEDSILFRKQEAENELKVLNNALSAKKVISVGTDIDKVLKVLEERGEKETIKIINYYVKFKGIEYFNNSIENIRTYISETKIFPEAYKLIGDIYRLEGEYDFAEEYYNLALENADILDIPDQKLDILYMLSQISKLKNNLPEMEQRLLTILLNDPFYKDTALFNSMMGTIKSNTNNSMEKYFTLYRASSFYCLNAYNELVQYYLSVNENEKALKLSALTVLTGFTKIYDILKLRNPEYEYTNLNEYFQEAAFYADVVEWGNKNNVWKSYFDLASLSYKMGYEVFSKELLKVLVQYLPDTYWQKTSVVFLDSID